MIKEQKHILQRKVFETTPGKTIWLSLVKDRNVNVLGLDWVLSGEVGLIHFVIAPE